MAKTRGRGDRFEVFVVRAEDRDGRVTGRNVWQEMGQDAYETYAGFAASVAPFCDGLAATAGAGLPVELGLLIGSQDTERRAVLDQIPPGAWFGSEAQTWAAVAVGLNEGLYHATRGRLIMQYDLLITFGLPIWRYIQTDRVGLPIRFKRTARAIDLDKAAGMDYRDGTPWRRKGPEVKPWPRDGPKITQQVVAAIRSDLVDGLGLEEAAAKHGVSKHIVRTIWLDADYYVAEFVATFGGPGVDGSV